MTEAGITNAGYISLVLFLLAFIMEQEGVNILLLIYFMFQAILIGVSIFLKKKHISKLGLCGLPSRKVGQCTSSIAWKLPRFPGLLFTRSLFCSVFILITLLSVKTTFMLITQIHSKRNILNKSTMTRVKVFSTSFCWGREYLNSGEVEFKSNSQAHCN